MTKQRLLHRPRPVLYDSGIVSRVLDDVFGSTLTDFADAHVAIQAKREVYIAQTTLFELQPVLRVLKNRYPRSASEIDKVLTDFNLIALDRGIGQQAVAMKRGVEQIAFADATIAATALVYGLDLFTLNEGDFALIPGLRLYKPRNYDELLARLGASKSREKQ